jgi:hypothetical protein
MNDEDECFRMRKPATRWQCLRIFTPHRNRENSGSDRIIADHRERVRVAKRTIAQAIELGTGFGHFHHTAYNIAATYAALHESDEAVNWAEAAADDGFPCYPYFARDPNLDTLREFPRFVDLMSQLHKQWRYFKQIL